MLTIHLRRDNEALQVHDAEIFDARVIGFRLPTDLDSWHDTKTGGAFRITGDLQVELCEAGPSDPLVVYTGSEIIGGPSAAVLKGPLGEVRITYGLKPYIFVSQRDPS